MSYIESPLRPMSAEDTAACIQFWNNTACRLSWLALGAADLKAGLDTKAVARLETPTAEGVGQLVVYLYVGNEWQPLPEPDPFMWAHALYDIQNELEDTAAQLRRGKRIAPNAMAEHLTEHAKGIEAITREMEATCEDGAPEWQPIPDELAPGVWGFYSILQRVQ